MPLGGSNPVGALGYVQAMSEIKAQVTALNLQIDHIFFATSSGGTQAGFVLGSKLCAFNSKLVGVSIDQVPDENSNVKFKQSVFDIIQTMADSMDLQNEVQLSDIIIEYGYLGAGYGVVGKVEKDAVRLMASTEGILVGPVYTGRALGALIDYVREGKIAANQNVLFIHTGDDIALHAYVHDFVLS